VLFSHSRAAMRKKVDPRVRLLVDDAVRQHHRCIFVMVGDRGRDQIVNMHYMLSKMTSEKPSVLWCYKKELGFSSNRHKRNKETKVLIKKGGYDPNVDDPFDLFVKSANVRFVFYKDTEKILGKTFGMCVLQDFEALTPNLMCRTMETVQGGGVIIILLKTMGSLQQLYNLSMDVHSKFRTETHQDIEPRFNERFLLSLPTCEACLVVDDELNILPLTGASKAVGQGDGPTRSDVVVDRGESHDERVLRETIEEMAATPVVGPLVGASRTVDQAQAVMQFMDTIGEKTLRHTMVLTAGRGRGKSAALGLAIAGAIANGYANIFVTAPSPENVGTVFEFVLKGFDALGMEEHKDYSLVQAEAQELHGALVRINVFRDHRQTVQYAAPEDNAALAQAELVVIDEAAAIPLPVVKKLLGPYLILMSSTVNGYEGTGRALSLKLVRDLKSGDSNLINKMGGEHREVKEMVLQTPIRYSSGDPVESWLYRLLCLDATVAPPLTVDGLPMPCECQLFMVNRNALFSGHRASEKFLHQVMSLFVSSHYKNTPNDMILMSDAPQHHVFVLVPPVDRSQTRGSLPQVLVVVQIAMEGALTKEFVRASMKRGLRPSGDLIPWTLSQNFCDNQFAQLAGARVVRIATHPQAQSQGYASEAIRQLCSWMEGKIGVSGSVLPTTSHVKTAEDGELHTEQLAPRQAEALLHDLSDTKCPYELDYLGTSFGLTLDLFNFWQRNDFVPSYLRQVANETTGEYSCIMLRELASEGAESRAHDAIVTFLDDFRRRFLSLLGGPFREVSIKLALTVLEQVPGGFKVPEVLPLSEKELLQVLSRHDLHRLTQYSRNLAEYSVVMDLMPAIAKLYFAGKLGVRLSSVQAAVLLTVGGQRRSLHALSSEFGLPQSQVLALMSKAVHKVNAVFARLLEEGVTEEDPTLRPRAEDEDAVLELPDTTLREEQNKLASEIDQATGLQKKMMQKELKKVQKFSALASQAGQAQKRSAEGSGNPAKKKLKKKSK